jgi:hypothetical protein
MYTPNESRQGGFPDPLADAAIKESREYGLKYAKSIESQWGSVESTDSLLSRRNKMFERNRNYANGTQDTTIYKQLLNTLDPGNNDGSLMNLDYTPVPVLPKFVRVVVNKILSRSPYPNVEAVDPVSSSEKNDMKRKVEMQINARKELLALKQQTGVVLDIDPEKLPETPEEAEIFLGVNIKTTAEVAAQIATNMTLTWNSFTDNIYRRCVNDIVSIGMAVSKRRNDPNYGIVNEYIDPARFVHSYTEDPNFSDISYAGHVKRITINELRRISNGELDEEQLKKIAQKVMGRNGNDSSAIDKYRYDDRLKKNVFGYDEYMVDVLDFEFLSVDKIYFEEKENRYGNTNFFYKGFQYEERTGSVYERKPHYMNVVTVYGGSYILDCNDYIFGYGRMKNIPKNVHDITRARMSYSIVATNFIGMMPKSMVDGCVGFSDMLQLTHLKIQQAIAKAKPDGLIIDIEGLENVQLGKGGELQPLDLHDIYEQTGVFYYRSKNPEGGFQNPPIREIGNSIRNINELIGIYNHYLRMIRDVTGINEVVDASSPKTDALVGVREQAMAASNNATYDITNAAIMLFKQVCEDIVKCIQILPEDSVIYRVYENAIGKENMSVLSSFKDLPMYNFGVRIVKEMEDEERAYLEQNIQISLQQQQLDIEDAIAIRNIRDINQAELLLISRRKKRMKAMQEQAMQNSQMQAQIQQQSAQATSQAKMQEMQMQAQIEAQKMQLQAQLEAQMEQIRHQNRMQVEMLKAQAMLGFKTDDKEFKEKIEVFKENRKDERVDKQAEAQSKLIAQRKGNNII